MSQSATLTLSPAQQRWLGGGVIVIICLASFWLAMNPAWVQRLGHWGYLGAFLISLIASATIILPAPGIVVIMAMGAALNPILLGVVAGLGSAVGELTGYAAGRGGRALIPTQQQKQFEQIQTLTKRYGPLILALLAAIPFPLFDFAGIVAGTSLTGPTNELNSVRRSAVETSTITSNSTDNALIDN